MKKLSELEERFDVKIRLLEKLLGTVPKDPEVYTRFVASKAPEPELEEEETETVEEVEERGWTGFHKNEQGIFIYNYMIKGFLKSACEVCMSAGALSKIVAYKKWIDLVVFIDPRQIPLGKKEPDGCLERPLRTLTAKGPRVTVCRSDYVDAGTEIQFTVRILKNKVGINRDAIEQMLDYGKYVGLGQWRGSGGYGRFEIVEVSP
ncbi:hypothetical protein J7J18_06425 [bacterium]|nr:hypothetical protein [bacterium]